jgi:hypothetical protein
MTFRLNIISNNRNQTGLSHDADLIHGIFGTVFGENLKVARTPHFHPTAPECDLNIFLEVINPILFNYAAKNIWIPNPEWTYKTWKPYMEMVDEIWVKTREAEEIFKALTTKPVRYIGWSSITKEVPDKKNYTKAFVAVGKNIFRHPQMLVDAYASAEDYALFPDLYIPYDSSRLVVNVPENVEHKVHRYPNTLKQKEYDDLLEECGLMICLSGAEGFGHAVNEGMSSGCNLLLGRIRPFEELTTNAIWIEPEKSVPHPECFIDIRAFSEKSILEGLRAYSKLGFRARRAVSEKVVDEYTTRHTAWISRMQELVGEYKNVPSFSISDSLPKEEDLPSVSILTPTRDRLQFMELAKTCFESLAYPKDKLEWVIIDDGEMSCKHIVKDMPNVKYIWEETGKTIAWKRNLAVRVASHDILVHMDDDDIYPNNSVLSRVTALLRKPEASCVFCSTIPCYDITNYISFVNVPPTKLEMAARVSEATMCYTRAFWQKHPFDDEVKIAEGHTFIHGRELMCREICPQEVIVSLVHPKTTSSRKAPKGMEPNGCHYGFSDDLFKAVSEIGESLKTT